MCLEPQHTAGVFTATIREVVSKDNGDGGGGGVHAHAHAHAYPCGPGFVMGSLTARAYVMVRLQATFVVIRHGRLLLSLVLFLVKEHNHAVSRRVKCLTCSIEHSSSPEGLPPARPPRQTCPSSPAYWQSL